MTTAPTRDTEAAVPPPHAVEEDEDHPVASGHGGFVSVAGTVAVILVAALMGAGLWARLVYDPTPAMHRITVVGKTGNGRVVDVQIDPFRGAPVADRDVVRTGDWVDEPPGSFRLASGRGRLTYAGAVAPTALVRFATGVDGGDARVVVDGSARPFESLRAEVAGTKVVRLHFDRRVPPASWALLVLLMAACAVPVGAAWWALRRLARSRGRGVTSGVVAGAAIAGVLTGVALWSPPTVLADARRVDSADDLLAVLSRIGPALAIGVLAVLVACALLGVRAPRIATTEPTTAAERWRLTALLAAVPLAGWTALLLLFWPGLSNPDGMVQWFELDRIGLDDWHPYLFALVLGALRHVADTPALPVLLQVIVASLLVGRIAAWTVWRGRSPWVAGATLALLLVVPSTALFTITMWKDTPFGLALLGLALVVWRIEDTGGEWLAKPRNIALAATDLAALSLTRHTGWPVAVGTIAVLLVAHRRRWRPLALTAGAAAAVLVIVQIPLASALDVTPNVQPSIIYVQHIANQVNRGVHLTGSERRFLRTIHPLGRDWPYDCHSIQPTWSGPDAIPPPRFTDKESRLRSLVVDLALRNPTGELDHLACASELVWKPWASDGETYFLEWSDTGGRVDYIPRLGQTRMIGRSIYGETPTEDTASPRAVARVYDTVVNRIPVWLLRPAIYLYALLAAMAFAAWRRRSWGVVRIVVPVILASLVLAALTLVQDVRFQYGVILTAVVLVPALLTVAPRRTADDTAPLSWDEAAPG